MYHCHLSIYLIGKPCSGFETIKKMHPLEHFTHNFYESVVPDKSLAGNADIILIDLHNTDVNDINESLQVLISSKRKESELIVLSDKDQFDNLTDKLSLITDIWILPMSNDEISFRFLRWQQTCKTKKDYWQTNHFFETTINSVPNLIWYKTKDGIHEKVNDSFCKTVNKTKMQVEGRDHYYIWDVDPDDPANKGYDCMESDLEVIRQEQTCISEETVKTGDGIRLLTTYKSPLYDLDGTVMGTVGVGIDITQERAYEQEILNKSHTLETIFTSIDCGILCHSLDGTNILSINKTALKILGYDSLEELEAMGFDMVAPSVLEEDKPILRNCIKTLTKEGDSVNIEYRVRHKNGDIIHVTGNVKLLKENGELFYQRFLLDCTSQKLIEKKTEKQHMELLQALSMDYNLVCFFSLNTGAGIPLRIDEYNNGIFGSVFTGVISLSESMEYYINELVYEDDREMMRQICTIKHLKRELSEKKQYYVNFRTYINGEIKYYEMKTVRTGIWNESHGIILGFRSIDEETRNEIQQKKLLEDALLQANRANKAKSVFLSNMSHDIRTPMNAIVGFTALATRHIDCKEQVQEYLNKITTSGNHLLTLLNDVLDMSRIESGKMQLEESSCSLPDILHNLVTIIQSDIHSKQHTLHIDTVNILDENFYCDKLRLNQVLLNVISNAIKYTHSGGNINITVTEKREAPTGYANYEFRIKDTGIGMNSDFLTHIFEPFEREMNTTTSGIEGTGLGMAITKNIVDMMKGNINVESEKGKGTTVTLSFDFLLNNKTNNHNTIPELMNCNALIINAEDNTRTCATYMFNQMEMHADWASSVDEALSYIENSFTNHKNYSVYIIDWQTPDMDIENIAKTLNEKTGKKTPIIVLTKNSIMNVEIKAKNAGVTAFCHKPLFLSKLRNCLYSIVHPQTEQKKDISHASERLRNGRILLAEDNELNQEIATAILSDAGFHIDIAENGQIAADMLKNSEPGYYNLILMDIQMPVLNGYEATKVIRQFENKKLASIPILAMTANAFDEDKQHAINSGMNGHISKPIDINKLLEELDKVLN